MTYRRAKSLDKLVAEVNARFPNRSKASDGWIGDPDHASRESDHNPWVEDGTTGVVTAQDITEDDAPGVAEIADFVVLTLVRRRDKRVKYLICDGRIWRSYDKPGIPAWSAAPYNGPNGHFKHCHVSVRPEKALYDSTASWGIAAPYPILRYGTRGSRVLAYTAALRRAGYRTTDTDLYQSPTVFATEKLQKARGWSITGVAGYKEQRAVGLPNP